eukprot:Pompholyxophrys_punicea_v1_NODE_64_length_3937_cov_2.858836.p6 type:complete len:139 gc:universal NODE_64_length_3937_cov_2.858836:900-484(-)
MFLVQLVGIQPRSGQDLADRRPFGCHERPLAVDGLAGNINDAAEHLRANGDAQRGPARDRRRAVLQIKRRAQRDAPDDIVLQMLHHLQDNRTPVERLRIDHFVDRGHGHAGVELHIDHRALYRDQPAGLFIVGHVFFS